MQMIKKTDKPIHSVFITPSSGRYTGLNVVSCVPKDSLVDARGNFRQATPTVVCTAPWFLCSCKVQWDLTSVQWDTDLERLLAREKCHIHLGCKEFSACALTLSFWNTVIGAPAIKAEQQIPQRLGRSGLLLNCYQYVSGASCDQTLCQPNRDDWSRTDVTLGKMGRFVGFPSR